MPCCFLKCLVLNSQGCITTTLNICRRTINSDIFITFYYPENVYEHLFLTRSKLGQSIIITDKGFIGKVLRFLRCFYGVQQILVQHFITCFSSFFWCSWRILACLLKTMINGGSHGFYNRGHASQELWKMELFHMSQECWLHSSHFTFLSYGLRLIYRAAKILFDFETFH